jgi:hypothetical protein
MRAIKTLLEKPFFVWLCVAIAYAAFYFFAQSGKPFTEKEQKIFDVVAEFSQAGFPPKIHLVRDVPDWGHLGFYSIMGEALRVFGRFFSNDPTQIRLVQMFFSLAAFLVFVLLGKEFTYKNRLSPFWISVGLLVFAANPYAWDSALHLGYLAGFLLVLLLSLWFFERQWLFAASFSVSIGVLIDWRALLLALAFVIARARAFESKILRPERMALLVLPFAVASLPILAWKGLVPQGEAREWWQALREKGSVSIEAFFYTLIILPLYAPYFTWKWALRARVRALTAGAVLTAVCIPLYFLFPIEFDAWHSVQYSLEVPLGIVDHLAVLLAGPYKNLALFVPWVFGVFLCMQLFLMEILHRSRVLRYFIVFYLAVQPLVIGYGDEEFLMVLPFILLLTLSEALVGEEGKLA